MIPKVLHFMWLQGIKKAPKECRRNPERWAEKNPNYSVRFWTAAEVLDLIETHFPSWLDTWERMPGKTFEARVIKRADMARLMVISKFGGIYLDMDLVPIGPSLDQFFRDPWIYNKDIKHQKTVPEHPSRDSCKKRDREIILSREHCIIDKSGRGVANGMLMSEKENPFWSDFMESQRGCENGLVLDFMGTWALTRYIRARKESLKGKMLVLPPHYFLWEPHYFTSAPPDYVMSLHPANNSWGDHNQKHWWMI